MIPESKKLEGRFCNILFTVIYSKPINNVNSYFGVLTWRDKEYGENLITFSIGEYQAIHLSLLIKKEWLC